MTAGPSALLEVEAMAPSKTDSFIGVERHSSPPKLLKFLLNGAYRLWDRFSWCLLPHQVLGMPDPYIRPCTVK